MLDWTRNPLVAAYFAVEGANAEDSAIHVTQAPLVLRMDLEPDPFAINEPKVWIPEHFSPRIAAQSGVLMAVPQPCQPVDIVGGKKLTIANAARSEIRRILAVYGVHRGTLFPDLDGQAFYVAELFGGKPS